MALRIKITRIGRTNNPKYRVIVAEAKSKRDGKYIDKIGFYDPIPDPYILNIDKEKLAYWVKNGATFTKGTQRLLRKYL
ncbi:30S ribosomal protein S16 [Candidatus Roizmanbacteria bacterium RIFCSPLOWO2_01_FULL_42_14]|uniref:Small ribosomal subunit protein bS16 n=4 Tax=Candidatus Roizmaniibacteriota TaxID=1752723 RepID=A0A1F7K1P6_9BACT|nr:MAG: 30S ribosomal protein S16 [Candidatus Roizmanbacteria bacterium RIFCSPHIGHO2_02_FULL_43_11]OGK38499.1 MAG: 30S ribosomal protein S16 [Candidatus Roizmanbacteria bacterium RIFCSPHIGHO2_12_FULL_42_10]OGK51667.1 MAG: 30S ribosomal protein S16 [Candidatus Roizmanbacteria bacterium RIFCSPLOWO2_01_FULL_42_14]OGK61747.1 MAG: 30S ribosomal protein S16 [Candidatus Roizmanbacteria bacterium RIFCSPLOWO2_02_FULL_43_10]